MNFINTKTQRHKEHEIVFTFFSLCASCLRVYYFSLGAILLISIKNHLSFPFINFLSLMP